MVASWDNLGDMNPDHYDPSGIDPFTMRDLKDPSQAAGPVEPQGPTPTSARGLPVAQQMPTPRGIGLAPDSKRWDDLGSLMGMDGYLYGGGRNGLGQDVTGVGPPAPPDTSALKTFTSIPWEQVGKMATQATDVYLMQQQLQNVNRQRIAQGLQPVSQLPVRKPAVPTPGYGMSRGAKIALAVGAVAAVGLGIYLWRKRKG